MSRNRNRNPFAGQQQQQGLNGAQIVPMLVHPQFGILGPATDTPSFNGTQASGWSGGGQGGLNLQGVPGAKQLRRLMRTMQFGQSTNTNVQSQIRGIPGAKQIRRILSQLQGGNGGRLQGNFGGGQGTQPIQALIQALMQSQGGQGYGFSGQGQGQDYRGFGPQGYGRGDDYSGHGPRGGNAQRSDDQVREDVIRVLTEHPRVDARDIEVRVRGGEVTLEGNVPHREMKAEAYRLVDRIPGVQQVFDTVRVQQRDYQPVQNNRQSRESRASAS